MQIPTRPGRGAARAAVGVTVAALAVGGLPAPASAAPLAHVSEIRYDDTGADTGEFVEVVVPDGADPAGLSLVLYDGSVLEFLSYEGTVTATDGPAAGTAGTDIGVREADSTPAGHSLSRAAAGGAWSGPAPATRGAVDGAAEEPAPGPADVCAAPVTHAVGAVQGRGAATPLAGRTVTVRGTVVADLQGPDGLEGFHLQDAGDGDPATSDGVFVLSTVPVALGDEVAVTGVPSESSGQTQVTAPTGVAVCADDLLPEPAAASLDLPADDAARERVEGMLVRPADPLTVSEVFALTRYGELTLSEGGVLVQPTEVARPGTPEAAAVAAGNAARRVLLDDGRDDSRSLPDRPYLSPETPVRVGDVLRFTEPLVLGHGFGQWRFQPADGTADGVFAPQDTRTPAPGPVGGDVRLATFNVLNYFLTSGGAGRGADSREEFEEQAGKIVPAIRALGADVVTLLEIEDTDTTGLTPGDADTALADLVRRLDEAEGAEVWAYVPLPQEL